MIVLGVTLGDATGIGPEVAVKAATNPAFAGAVRVLVGDVGTIQSAAALIGWNEAILPWPGRRLAGPGLWQLNPPGTSLPTQGVPGNPQAALAALEWLREGTRLCLVGELDGLVTGPVNKQAILESGIPFVGQTEFLTELAGNPPTAMMLLGTDDRGRWLRVVLATTHLPLRDVPEALTIAGVRQAIELASGAGRRLGLDRTRIAVCGLNPHAGEGGQVGREEIDVIQPAVAATRMLGLDVHGPFAADTLFYQALRGDYDVVVAMYHDQGLGPLKLVAFDTGVNWTVGLPFVRTSPDHGTAYDLAGRGVANPASMNSAMRLAIQLVEAAKGLKKPVA